VIQTTPMILAIVAIAGVLVVLARLDSWRRLYFITILLLFAATCNQPQIAAVAYYPRYLAAGVLASWTWYHHRHEARRLADLGIGPQRLVKGLWLAVAVGGLSTLWSVDKPTTASQTLALGFLTATVHGLVTRRWTDIERVADDLGVAAVLLAVMFGAGIVADWVGLGGTRTVAGQVEGVAVFGGRFAGLYNNPNELGMTCALVLPICWGAYRWTGKRMYLLATIPTAASLVLSESRTAAVAVICGILWVLARKGLFKVIPIAVAASFTACVSYLVAASASIPLPAVFSSLSSRFTANQGGDLLNTRTVAWNYAFTLWQREPVSGYGYGSGPSLFSAARRSGALNFAADVVHNSYLQWLLELGLAGLLPLAVLLLACAGALRARLDPLGAALVCTVVAGLLIQMTESGMFGTGETYPFIFWLVVAGVLVRTGTDRHRVQNS